MVQVYGCGYNGFQQLGGFETGEYDLTHSEDSQIPTKRVCQSKQTKPIFLCKCHNAVVEGVKMTWSRIAVSFRKRTGSYTTAVSYQSNTDETRKREALYLDNFTCQGTTDNDILLKDMTNSKNVVVLKSDSNVIQPISLCINQQESTQIELHCVSGSHEDFYCVYDGIAFGQFSCSNVNQSSEKKLESIDRDEQSCPISLPVHHIDSVITITDIHCGKEHVLLLAKSGSVYSYGLSSRGQLGHGDVENETSPRLIESLEGLPIKAIATGGWHSVALSEIGDVYVWGWNESGQLGLPTRDRVKSEDSVQSEAVGIQSIPKRLDIPGDSNVIAIACGARHTVVLTENGDVFTCGWNNYGQLGLENAEPVDTLTEVTNIPGRCSQIFAGQWNSVFVCKD